MGNRIIKDSILTDDAFNFLTFFEESLYHRLVVSADDYGIYYAQPRTLSRILFPCRGNVTETAVRKGLGHMEALGLIRLYTVKGAGYLKLCGWDQNQRLRNSRHRYPTPEEADDKETAGAETEPAENHPSAEGRETGDPENEPAAMPCPQPEDREPPVVELPLSDHTSYGVTQSEIDEYAALYPAADVVQELRNMRGWCLANPQKRKTRNGIRKFINSWLTRVQNQGGRSTSRPAPASPPVNPFLEMLREEEARERAAETAAADYIVPTL